MNTTVLFILPVFDVTDLRRILILLENVNVLSKYLVVFISLKDHLDQNDS
jgi:hypothetical protein